ncbi:Mannosyl-oligosaccharide 1,2-alpha-mannosidase IB [Dermatophagoides farinae]|nr:Mannosyl-oligosaccharide 1,2-alpha-mannosidase IB [Dermatophagoides farinae]
MAIGHNSASPLLSSTQQRLSPPPTTMMMMIHPRSVLRIREKYLLLAIIIIFMVISLIGMAYLPELKTSKVYLQYIKPADSLGPQLLGLIPPNDNDDNFNEIGGMQMVNDGHNNNYQQQQQTAILPPPPRGRFDDEKRLSEKIQQHFSQQQKTVIPKPNIPKSSPTSSPIVQSNSLDNHHDNVNNQHLVALYEPIRRQSNWTRIQLPNGEDGDPEIRKKRDKIKQMMIVAWDSYKKYAWGENELKPIKKTGHAPGVFGKTKLGATIVDGMDTLYIMGLMDRFEDGRQWIAENLDFNNIGSEISVFETIIRYVGGLLTCYAFTKDEMFLQKAVNITQRMLPAFDTPTGLPHALIKPALGTSRNYAWASQSNSILSEVGTLSLEFYYLTALTGDQIYYNKIDRIQTILDSLPKPNGLYPNYINPKTGKFGQKHISLGALGDSFYEYL